MVVGTWEYPYLGSVPAAENSLRRMAGLLAGPLCGWPRERLLPLANEASPGDLPDRLITAFDSISDVALFYYVGHGQISPDDQLCLGLVQSRPDPNRRAATSLRFSDVRQALQDSGAAIKIVILDCCFAGLATSSPTLAGLAGEVLDLTAGTGAYTMAATSAYATAWYEDGPALARPQTHFTRYLADLIEEGIPGQPSRLRLDPIFKQLRDNLAADQRPIPSNRAVNDAREFTFAYNAAPLQTHRDPEREVVQLNQQLAETNEQIRVLKAEAAERASELERLRQLMATARPQDPREEHQLRDAISEASRRLDDTRAAQAAAAASPRPSATIDYQESPHALPAPQQAGYASAPKAASAPKPRSAGPTPARKPRRRLGIGSILAAGIAAAGITILVLSLPSGSRQPPGATATGTHSPATQPSSRPSPSSRSSPSPSPSPATHPPIWQQIAILADPGFSQVDTVAFSLNGTILAAGDFNGSTYLWSLATHKVTATLTNPGRGAVTSVAFSPNGTTLAIGEGSTYRSTYLWSLATHKITATFTDPGSGPDEVAFSPSGTILAVGDNNDSTYLWSIAAHTIIATLTDPGNHPSSAGGISSVAFSPNGAILAVADANGITYLWNVATHKIMATLTDPGSPEADSVAFSPNGTTLAVEDSYSGSAYLWSVATHKIMANLTDPGPSVASVAFSPDGTTLAMGDGFNGSTYLWNVATREITATLTAHGIAEAGSVVFSPNGDILAIADPKGSTYLWSALG